MDVTWESLEAYISNYSGRTRLLRLIHVADISESLRYHALQVALVIIEQETLDSTLQKHVLEGLLSMHSFDLSPHTAWAMDAGKKSHALSEKLENELKAYKNNLIKESIRMGQQDIARHLENCGNLPGALRALIRNRDFCTTPNHVYDVNMNIINLSVLLGQWTQVQLYCSKIASSAGLLKEQKANEDHLRAASALALINQSHYKESAQKLQSIDSTIGTSYNIVISMNDIANFTCLLALATYSRKELYDLIESSSFKPFLELEPNSREALECFYQNRFADCFQLIEIIRPDMLADVYFATHTSVVFDMIRERSYIQYMKAFSAVAISRISNSFALSPSRVEADLKQLIRNGKLSNVRIDLQRMLVLQEMSSTRHGTYIKNSVSSRAYMEEMERGLLQLTLSRGGLQVEPLVDPPGPQVASGKGHAYVPRIDLSDEGDIMELS